MVRKMKMMDFQYKIFKEMEKKLRLGVKIFTKLYLQNCIDVKICGTLVKKMAGVPSCNQIARGYTHPTLDNLLRV